MGFIARLMGRRDETALPLYTAIVARAREPHWYEAGVPDTVDGRFDMIATTLAFVLLRLEDDPEAAEASARLTERFVDDMDGQLREIGIGDIIVGKHIGKMMGMLGGRLGAYRTALADGTLGPALVRNLWRGETPEPAALAHVETALLAFRDSLAARTTELLLEGVLP
ncbi:MAG: ubiquinol-cytochrome chaperone [Sphingomonas bacterium]|nr:ubiquinol-cytochrome chaperone [Sphingomonas bacterium]